jgi:membrane protein DedA with SNARE-associated domain
VSPGRIAAAVAAAALAALVAARRRRLGLERSVLVGLVAVALAVYASGVLSELPNPEHVIEDLATALGGWTYVLVGAMAFLETGAFVGLVAPGEFTVIVGGVVAGQGEIELVPLIGLVWICAILGDTTSFFIGQRLGRSFLERHGPRVKITGERLEQVEGYFERHGGKTILIGRFIGLVRSLAPFIAGSSRMPYRGFLPYSVIGTGLWAATFTVLGYVFYRSFSRVADVAGRATIGFGIVVGTIAATVWAYRRLRDPQQRRRLAAWLDRQGRRPLLRPLAAVVRPLATRVVVPAARVAAPRVRFVIERLTPGNLGIELTSAVAIAAGGLFVFVLYASALDDGPRGPLPFDSEVADAAREVRTDVGVDVAKVATDLASLPVVGALVLIAAVLLASRRRFAYVGALVLGLAIVWASVRLAKEGIDRPRPAGSLVATEGQSYPSGHAAYSTAYVALAVAAARVLPGLASRAGFVLAVVIGAATVGATRVFLGAHYWSDVAGGWGLGLGVFGACAAIAMIVSHVRNNPSEERE